MTGVSFVVTVYNKAPFLPAVLGAIFAQEGDFARQVIVVDDGSTDASAAILERLAATHPEMTLIRQQNGGPAKATNVAVKHATQPWLKIVDGDDILAPYATRLLLEAANSLKARFALGRNVWYDVADLARGVAFPGSNASPPRRRDLLGECLRNAPCNLTPTLIDRGLYWDVGGCDERVFTQDFSLLLRLAWRETPAATDAVVSASPAESAGRVSGNVGRMLSDVNRSIAYFVRETPGLSFGQRRLALERAFGRAWKWQHRKRGASWGSRWFWLYALAKLAPGLAAPHIESTVDAFAEPRA